MPADVNLFDMHKPNVLKGFSDDELQAELEKTIVQLQRVTDYQYQVVQLIAARMKDR